MGSCASTPWTISDCTPRSGGVRCRIHLEIEPGSSRWTAHIQYLQQSIQWSLLPPKRILPRVFYCGLRYHGQRNADSEQMSPCNPRIFLYPTSPSRSHCLYLYHWDISGYRGLYISAYDAVQTELGASRDPYDHSDCVRVVLHRDVGDPWVWHQDQYISWVLPTVPDLLSYSRQDLWGYWVHGSGWVPSHDRYRSLGLLLLYVELPESLVWWIFFSREISSDWVSTCRTRGISSCVCHQKTPLPSPSVETSPQYANWYWKTASHQNGQIHRLRDACSHGDDPSGGQ